MALFKKFTLLPPLRSPESFYATYRGPWLLVKKWPLVYLQTTKKAPKSISAARTDGLTVSAITICLPKFLWGHKKLYNFEARFCDGMIGLIIARKECNLMLISFHKEKQLNNQTEIDFIVIV